MFKIEDRCAVARDLPFKMQHANYCLHSFHSCANNYTLKSDKTGLEQLFILSCWRAVTTEFVECASSAFKEKKMSLSSYTLYLKPWWY